MADADSLFGPDTDFLLSSNLYQKRATGLTASTLPVLSSYFTSLWLQETSHDIVPGLSKKTQFVLCPHCGVQRNPSNFSVRVKRRKRQSKSMARYLSRSLRTTKAGDLPGRREIQINNFEESRNRLNYKCNYCKKQCTIPGITRKLQKDLLAAQQASIMSGPITGHPIKQREIAVNSGDSLPMPPNQTMAVLAITNPPVSSSSKKKKRRKDVNAGLHIPTSSATKTSWNGALLQDAAKKRISQQSRPTSRPSQTIVKSALQKFLL